MGSNTLVIVTARNEADRIGATLAALSQAFPGASVWLADDGSCDRTAEIAQAAGARVLSGDRPIGKGGAATLAANQALAGLDAGARTETVIVLCDGDLGESAARLGALADAVRAGQGDLVVAAFARRVGGGFGIALRFARWAIHRRCGLWMAAPISGQRALGAAALVRVLPFAPGFGMEIGMTIDASRAGLHVTELQMDLHHRATGRTMSGFLHRARQLRDFVRVYLAR